MKKDIEINLDRLIEDAAKRSQSRNLQGPTFSRNFGNRSGIYVDMPGNKKGVRIISQENAKFINVFGLFVDIETGNIALGLFPDSDNYVCIGNFYEVLSKSMFNTKTMPDWVDKRFLLEQMKLNPKDFMKSSYQTVLDMYQDSLRDCTKYSSILLNIASEWVDSTKEDPEEVKYFKKHNSSGDFVKEAMTYGISHSVQYDVVAANFFTVYIVENTSSDVTRRMEQMKNSTFGDLINDTAVGGNLESLYLMYVGEYHLPPVFLRALKSYGLGLKQRKVIVGTVADRRGNIKSYNNESLLMVAENLSSMLYLYSGQITGDTDRKAKTAGFNIIDLLKTVGWEESMLFSLDMVQTLHNRSVYDSLVKRFSIEELLLETKTSMKDFVMSLDTYRKIILPLIDNGSLYTRKTLPSQYAMSVFSPRQVESAGKVFESMSKMILKKFD